MPYSPQGMFNWAVTWCNTANVGYSQTYRNFRTVNGITYFDCSSFTFFACWLGGNLDIGAMGYSTNIADYREGRANAWTVTTMISSLINYGWNSIPISNAVLQPGDILAKTRTHCEIYYGDTPIQTMGARNSSLPLADQVAIHQTTLNYIRSYYDLVLRPNGGQPPGPVPTQHRGIPLWMLLRYLP